MLPRIAPPQPPLCLERLRRFLEEGRGGDLQGDRFYRHLRSQTGYPAFLGLHNPNLAPFPATHLPPATKHRRLASKQEEEVARIEDQRRFLPTPFSFPVLPERLKNQMMVHLHLWTLLPARGDAKLSHLLSQLLPYQTLDKQETVLWTRMQLKKEKEASQHSHIKRLKRRLSYIHLKPRNIFLLNCFLCYPFWIWPSNP